MPSVSDIQAFKELGVPLLVLLGVGYVLWRFVPAALDKHEAIVTKIASDSKAAVESLTADHKATVENLTADHKVTVDGLVHEFRAELKEQRDRNEQEHERRDEAINKLADAVDRISEKVK